MKIITQISMFDDTQNENLGDLERLQKVFDNLPDEKLIRRLKEKRGKGRNEWPVEAMWNSFIASFIFDHDSIASLLRELNRNSQLRIICGFQPHIYSVLADKGYDSTELIEWLTTERISPVIDIRNMCQGDETKQFKDMNIVYNYKGKVYYITDSGKEIELLYKGYDKSRDSQRYGFHPKYEDKRIFRIPLKTDPRIFTKVARNSKKWRRLYKKRTSIERVNGRIDRDFQFEKHTIRGLKKMKMFLTVTFIIQLTLAKAKIESGITNGLARYTA